MYRVAFWIGSGSALRCDLRKMSLNDALALKHEYEERGYHADLYGAHYRVLDIEAGRAAPARAS